MSDIYTCKRKRVIRFSEKQRFQWCRRSWMNGYFLSLTLPTNPEAPASGKRDIGTIFDLGIRYYYGFPSVHPLDTWARLKAEHIADHGELTKEWDQVYSLTYRMLEGYLEWIEDEGHDAGEITVGTEVECTLYLGEILGDDVYLQIHVDRLVYDTTWDEWIIDDTKTVDTLAKDQQFQVEDQLVTYAYVLSRVLGFPIRRARHNMARKVKRTGTAKPPFYGRVELNYNEHQIGAHEKNLYGEITRLVDAAQSLERGVDHHLVAPPAPSRDCTWKCDFLPICVAHDDGSDLDGLRNYIYVPYPERRT